MDDNDNGASDGHVETVEAGPADAEAGDLPPVNEAGFPLVGGYPLNSRLRSEALAQAGVTTDPDGIVSDEHIAATGAQLEAVAKAEAAAESEDRLSVRMARDKLIEIATAEGVAFEPDATKASLVDAITARRAANTEA